MRSGSQKGKDHEQKGIRDRQPQCVQGYRVPNADEHLVKAQLVFRIDSIMKERHMRQTEAAALFGVR